MQQEKTKLQEAAAIWGNDVVSFVRSVVNMSDPDGAYSQFIDVEMQDYAECVSFLYFE